MMNLRQLATILLIVMVLIPSVYAGDAKVVNKAEDTGKVDVSTSDAKPVNDKTKEKSTEITSKDKDIKGKITVTDTDVTKYTVKKKSSTEISISKQEAKGEHTKAKVSIPKSELDKIDIDNDGKFGVLRIGDNGEILDKDILTTAQLVSGAEMVFSENIVNGYSGYKQYTFNKVTSGQTLNIDDVSGNYTIGVAVDGVVPTYTAIDDNKASTYPSGAVLIMPMNNATNVVNGVIGTSTNVSFSNGIATFNGIDSYIDISCPKANLSDRYTLYAKYKTTTAQTGKAILSHDRANWKYMLYVSTNSADIAGYAKTSSGSIVTQKSSGYTLGTWRSIGYVFNISKASEKQVLYLDGVSAANTNTNNAVLTGNGIISIGRWSTNYFTGQIDKICIFNKSLSVNENRQMYAGGSGISFQPEPSYNFTGYNVASGVEKVLNTGPTCQQIEVVDTTGGTHNVTVTVYFTEDTTLISDSKGAVYQNVTIVHTKQNATTSTGTITYELDPRYSGNPVLVSNNSNATVTRTDTSFVISTGLVKQGQSFSYAVSVADNHDHGIHLNTLMKWVGTGWDFVSTAPDNWANYIGDEIEVTVS